MSRVTSLLGKFKTRFHSRLALITASFVFASASLQLASAADIDIYTKAVNFGKGGDPVMMFVIDTSGSMAFNMNNDNYSTNIFNDRMFQLQNALRDQLTAMKGSFNVGLFNYDANNKSGILQMESKPLKWIQSSSTDTPPGNGSVAVNTSQDVVWIENEAARDGENTLSFPVIVYPGGSNSLGGEINGKWTSSGGQNSNPNNGSYDYAGNAAGNKVVKYRATSNSSQTFWLERTGNGATPDPYLYILNAAGTVVHASNDDASAPTASCPNGWTYGGGGQPTKCHRQVEVNCTTDTWGGKTCDYQDQYQDPTISGGNINSSITISLTNGAEYTIVMGTKAPGQSGNFKLRITQNNRGNFFENQAGAVKAQNAAFRFNSVKIPKGAKITSASIRMRASANAPSQNLNVRVDQAMNPQPLTGTNIKNGRDWFTQPAKLLASINSGSYMMLDVKTLVESKLDQPEWCGGEDLVFMIDSTTPTFLLGLYTGLNPFVMESEEGGYDPQLQVSWTHSGGASCYSKTINTKVGAIGDDVQQAPNGSIVRESTTVEMGNGYKAGLRFGFIGLPNAVDDQGVSTGVDVKDARLTLRAANNNNNPGTIYIRAIHEGDKMHGLAQPFSNDAYDLDNRALGATIAWTPGAWTSGQTYTSPDLSSIILPLLQQETWEYQGTIGLIINASGINSTKFYAWEDANGNSTNRGGQGKSYNWNNLGTRAAELTIQASATKPFQNGDTYRKRLFDKLMSSAYIPEGGTPIAGSYVEAAEYMLGKGSYDSPLDEVGKCQANTLVLLTDGDDTAWGNNTGDFKAITGKNCSGVWGCSNSLAEGLKEGPVWYDPIVLPNDDGKRAIRTYTIGYGPIASGSTGGNLQTLANYGDGQYYPATDATKLASAFESIIGSISDAGASLSVPGVSVSAFNRLSVLDEVYYSLFKPSTRRNWAGNAKRYRLNEGSIKDVHGNEAINLDSTYFQDESQSWWSEVIDGPVVSVGGAAGKIDPATRNIYTYKGANGASLGTTSGAKSARGLNLASGGVNIRTNGDSLTATDLGMNFLGDLPPAQVNARRAQIVEWLQGGTVDNPRKAMGSPLHSSPTLVGYVKQAGKPVNTLYVSTNEGYLHAFDTGEPSAKSPATNLANRGGKELFAFVPKETLRMAALLEENAVVDPNNDPFGHAYGLDSTWAYWRESGDDSEINASNDHVYLYGGMRRGGRMMYGLNVTDVHHGGANKPKLLFSVGYSDIEGKATNAAYNNIGETWSVPRVRKTLWKGAEKTVLIFGGGHDKRHDNIGHETVGDDLGRQIYMLDAENGELLWWSGDTLDSSIVGSIATYDRTGDIYFDSFYAVDLQGRVLRFDMNSARNDFTKHLIANIGGTGVNNRKFYEQPSIARFQNIKTGEIDMMIAVGSGYRENPTNKTVLERFYLFFDRGAGSVEASAPTHTITTAGLTPITVNANGTLTPAGGLSRDPENPTGIYQVDGWAIHYAQAGYGEKTIGEALIFNGFVFFTTFNQKETGSNTCTPVIGQSRLYIVDIAGKGAADLFGAPMDSGQAFLDDVAPGMAGGITIIDRASVDGAGQGVSILIDKTVINMPDEPGNFCRLNDCASRDLDRGAWSSTTTPANVGKF